MRYIKKALILLIFPLLLIGAAYIVIGKSGSFSPSGKQALQYIPYFLFAISMLMGGWFNRSKIFFLSLVLGLSQLVLIWKGPMGVNSAFYDSAVFTFISVLIPVNILFFSSIKERGIMSAWGKRRLLFIAVQILYVAWVIWYNDADFIQLLNMDIVSMKFKVPGPFSQLSAFCFLFVFLYLFYKLARTGANSYSLFSGILMMVFAALAIEKVQTLAIPVLYTAIGLMLVKEVIVASYSMAYLDELTGLPSRRSLREQMMKLGSRYTVAMLDIDHFKNFNDTYGHDIGDQVLKLVAACIRNVGGGGKFFRYGGEEFIVIFPGKTVDEALPFLEELRERIADRNFVIRGKDRPRKKPVESAANTENKKHLSVTVSMGAAEKTDRLKSCEAVIKAADSALYRAKESGRNCICR